MDKFILVSMKIYHLYRRQRLNLTTHEAWKFFSSPYNLNDITPEFFHVTITSKVPEKIYLISKIPQLGEANMPGEAQ
jgi:ligand-binding SRPBCC domain-containing protein